jgi:hypothetical protein
MPRVGTETLRGNGRTRPSKPVKEIRMKKLIANTLFTLLLVQAVDAQIVLHKPRRLPPCQKDGQTVTLTLNSGTAGPVDPIWHLAPSSPAYTTAPYGSNLWLPNGAGYSWIQPSNNGGQPAFYPLNTYVYEAQFTTPVDPYLYSSIKILGDFALDDIGGVELNNVPIGNCPGGGTPLTWCFNKWTPIGPTSWTNFNRSTGYVNTLKVKVKNTLAGSPHGMVIRVRVQAVCSKCTSPVPPVEPPCGGNPSTC